MKVDFNENTADNAHKAIVFYLNVLRQTEIGQLLEWDKNWFLDYEMKFRLFGITNQTDEFMFCALISHTTWRNSIWLWFITLLVIMNH